MADQFGLQRQAVSGLQRRRAQLFPDPADARSGVRRGRAGQLRQEGRAADRAGSIAAPMRPPSLVLLLFTAGWANSYIGNRELIDDVHAAVDAVRTSSIPSCSSAAPNDADLHGDRCRRSTRCAPCAAAIDQREADTPVALHLRPVAGRQDRRRRAMPISARSTPCCCRACWPGWRRRSQANMDKPDFLYQALKVYLILGRQGPLDHDQVMAWLITDFNASLLRRRRPGPRRVARPCRRDAATPADRRFRSTDR